MSRRLNNPICVFDIDDTLFDWLSMWSHSFYALLTSIKNVTSLGMTEVQRRFRDFHVSVGTSEYDFHAEEISMVFKEISLESAAEFSAQLARQKAKLHILFPGIRDTLSSLNQMGVTVVYHTDSPPLTAAKRFEKLGLNCFSNFLYSSKSANSHFNKSPHRVLEYKKPDIRALGKILSDFCCTPEDCIYIGDSLYKDIAMAEQLNVTSVYAEYGCRRISQAYELLREVSHWTDEDILYEKQLSKSKAQPNHSVKNSNELLECLTKLL